MARESISKMKNRKVAGPSGVVSEMVKADGKSDYKGRSYSIRMGN